MSQPPATIYIMSRGHSGSTFLDVLLGNIDGIESVGEIVSGLNRGEEEICSCSAKVGDCPYWTAVRASYAHGTDGRDLLDDARWLWRQSDVRRFPRALFADINRPDSDTALYATLHRALIDAIASVEPSRYVLDSNKEFSRAVMILRSDPGARVIHLFRSPFAIVGSHYYRRKEKGLPFKFMKREYAPNLMYYPVMMLTAFAWSVAMALAVVVKARFPGRVLHVSYERLVSDPDVQFRRLGHFLDVDADPVIDGIRSGRAFPIHHNVGGNELRHDGSFTFIPNRKGRRKLPWHYRIGAAIFTAPGYLLRWTFVRA